jgi:hypothetical protein
MGGGPGSSGGAGSGGGGPGNAAGGPGSAGGGPGNTGGGPGSAGGGPGRLPVATGAGAGPGASSVGLATGWALSCTTFRPSAWIDADVPTANTCVDLARMEMRTTPLVA